MLMNNHRGVKHYHSATYSRGFTIVELLIVVVVIAILAAITIVAYNGIQNRAKNSAVQSTASQVSKKIALWQVDNPSQAPSSLAIAGVNTSGSSTNYQYTPSTGEAWCVTVTDNAVSYFVSNTASNPKPGGCPGHGQSGVSAITNLALRPIADMATWTRSYGTSGAGTAAVVADGRFPGNVAYESTWTTSPTSSSNLYIAGNAAVPCVVGQTYFLSMRYAASWAGMTPGFYISGANIGVPITAIIDRGDGTKEARAFYTAGSSCTTTFGQIITTGSGSAMPPVNATLRAGAVMIVAISGSETYTYADGSSTDWTWNGPTNNAQSSGPPR